MNFQRHLRFCSEFLQKNRFRLSYRLNIPPLKCETGYYNCRETLLPWTSCDRLQPELRSPYILHKILSGYVYRLHMKQMISCLDLGPIPRYFIIIIYMHNSPNPKFKLFLVLVILDKAIQSVLMLVKCLLRFQKMKTNSAF